MADLSGFTRLAGCSGWETLHVSQLPEKCTSSDWGCSGAEARSLRMSDPIVPPDLEAVLPSTQEKVEEPHY